MLTRRMARARDARWVDGLRVRRRRGPQPLGNLICPSPRRRHSKRLPGVTEVRVPLVIVDLCRPCDYADVLLDAPVS